MPIGTQKGGKTMDSAVWMMQAVVDQRRREREADGFAHRRARDAARSGDARGRRARPSRRQRRFDPAPVVAVAGAPEQTSDDRDLVGAGETR
jgi:hypothetical protein